ncbi:hypothetical protein A2881_01700 [Candidatus Peribacteria bacterium RIFCSPHIGHO2_01_FULL_55_13]|nr:MAG: hypothetical protein A2881_01700 [Candidatus Peribacteria bacterium RIFCSPHIGHO2_01_FULL_55_13]
MEDRALRLRLTRVIKIRIFFLGILQKSRFHTVFCHSPFMIESKGESVCKIHAISWHIRIYQNTLLLEKITR